MESLNLENAEKGYPLILDKKKIDKALWGRSIESGVTELIKVFSIIAHIKEKGVTTKEAIEDMASDLFEEFDVAIFDYDTIFTNQVISQILEERKIDTLSIDWGDTPIVIKKGSTVESVVNEWEIAGYNSPEAIAEREAEEKEQKEFVTQEQGIVNTMFSQLGGLDFTDLEKVIDWLYEYNTHFVDGVDIHKEALIETFTAKGYSPEKNDEIEFMLGETLQDKQRFGKAMVGYMLMNPGLFLRDNHMKDTIEEWKKS